MWLYDLSLHILSSILYKICSSFCLFLLLLVVHKLSLSTREWYSYHFPELVKIVADNLLYARAVKYIKSRKDLTEDRLAGLEEIVEDEAKTKAIYDASRSSMGMKT